MRLLKHLVIVFAIMSPMQATEASMLIWGEDFPDAQGNASDRATTSGSGFLDVNGTANFTGNGGLDLLAVANTRSSADFRTTDPVFAGVFQFDFALTSNLGSSGQDRAFVQMFEGDTRSSSSNPVDNFNDTLSLTEMSITSGQTLTLRYFFNVSNADLTYDAPDASSRTLGSGAYSLWIDNQRFTAAASSSANSDKGAGIPDGGVNTFSIALFNGQAGNIVSLANASLTSLGATAVPEPSGLVYLGIGLGAIGLRRSRRAKWSIPLLQA
ncbi:MAG: PEP-CTERM sorting domain-containing protein [Planctomycetota bacterium]